MVDYHVHTSRCGHATGTIEEYVESAIEKGITEIGFSDHAPMPESERSGLTMSAGETEPYIEDIGICAERYREKIMVRTGFETDYPLLPSFDRSLLSDPRIDYLIGSCHFIDGWGFDNPRFAGGYDGRNIDETYDRYFSIVESMAGSRFFDIIGHFDIVKKFGHRAARDFRPRIEKIAHIMAAAGTAFEINTAGMIHPAGEMYPSDDIIGIMFRSNVPVTTGSDSHRPGQIASMFPEAIEKLKKAGYRTVSGFSKRKRYDIPI